MEALASGLPVLTTADTGMKEYVQEGENGFVIATGDSDAILERIELLAETLRCRRSLRTNRVFSA
jgi:glycosyltransferase involved in cell wall biosynthesis